MAAGLTAVFRNVVFASASAQLETLFNLTVMAAIYVVVSGTWARGELARRRLVIFGAVVGLSALVRPFSLLFLPALGIVAWAMGAGRARVGRQLVIAGAAAAVVRTPWTIRNVRAMHAPVFIATNLGEALCLDRHPGATGAFDDSTKWCLAPYRKLPFRDMEVARNRGDS